MFFRQSQVHFIVACGLMVSAAGPALGQFVELNNGLPRTTDGHLRINPDAFGSWTAGGFGGEGDQYNPPGGGPPLAPKEVMFSNGFFLFRNGTQRELLSESTNWQSSGSIGMDTTLEREITTANSVNAGVATSSFRVFDPMSNFDVSFDLEQTVTDGPKSTIAFFTQTYTITNNSGEDVAFEMVRAADVDLRFAIGQTVTDDEVGTNTNMGDPPGTTSVWQRDPVNALVSTIRLSAENNGGAYYGGLEGDMPGGMTPAMGLGTSTEVWQAFGVPANWRNYVSNVGYNMDGQSGQAANQDAFIGLEFPVDLAASATTSFTLDWHYGLIASVTCDFNDDETCDGTDINMMMAAIAGGADPPEFDLNNDGSVDNGDRDEWLQQAGDTNIGAAYLIGDATLDGIVDGLDFIEWNNNKFTSNTDWTGGEFTGDGTVDGLDFIEWNNNKFTSSMDLAVVPEPSSAVLLTMLMGLGAVARKRRRWSTALRLQTR